MTIEQIAAIIGAVASLLCTVTVGALAFFIKRTLTSLEDSDKRNAAEIKEVDRRQTEAIKELSGQFNDLKSDMPLVYTLREDFIRSMNSVDHNLGGLDQKLDRAINLITHKKEE